jgi:hypothetical protein
MSAHRARCASVGGGKTSSLESTLSQVVLPNFPWVKFEQAILLVAGERERRVSNVSEGFALETVATITSVCGEGNTLNFVLLNFWRLSFNLN